MYIVESNKKVLKSSSKEEIIDNLFKAYLNIGYSPEYYDNSTILIKTPVEFIVSFIDTSSPVSLSKLHKLWTPLKDISAFTGINNYILISKHGFKEECYSVEGYAVRLETMDYVKSILKANPSNKPLELMPHNHLAFKNLMAMWKTERFASIVHATGTGKSFIIAKVLQSYAKDKVILACPTIYIQNQFKELFSKFGINSNRIDFVTYSKLSKITKSELDLSHYDLIILDELHRTGAEFWGAGVKRIIEKNKKAKVLGVTATPIRYLDDRRNMTEELFEGNVASSLDLFEAMGRGILPIPKYVEALYNVSHDLSSLENSIRRSSAEATTKESVLEDIRRFKISWDSVHSIKNIINKHYTPEIAKVIVFCKNVSHLKKMKPIINDWFTLSGVYKNVNIFEVYSSSSGSRDELKAFKEPVKKGDVNILLSVDKLNEGIHVEGVNSVIFLRSSASQNIILQQIGRALSATSISAPIILDLINNVEVLGSQSFYNGLNSAINSFNDKITRLNLIQEPIANINFDVLDETKDFISFIKETLSKISKSWEEFLADSVECKKRTGWFPGPNTPNEDSQLISWVSRQRTLMSNGVLSQKKIARLNDVGFFFSFNKEKWVYMYNRLIEYKAKQNVTSFVKHVIKDKELDTWIQRQRQRYKLNRISDEEYTLLKDAGISFSTNKDLWDYYINRLQEFYTEHGYKFPSEGEDTELYRFCVRQRTRRNNNTLSVEKLALLNSINFVWEPEDSVVTFDDRINELKDYIKSYGDTLVSTSDSNFGNLGLWVAKKRRQKRNGTLPKEQADMLDSLNFCWDPELDLFTKQIEEVIEYTKAKQFDNSITSSKSIYAAMRKIRKKYHDGKLSSDIIDKLNAVGFDWCPKIDTWDIRVNQLKEYYSLYNTFKIVAKSGFPDYHALAVWLRRQAKSYKKGTYPIEKQKELESIGFDFNKEYTFNNK